MKWMLIVGALVVVIVLVLLTIGYLLPVDHTASRQATFAVPPDLIWKIVTTPEEFPAWRTDVTRVERLPDREGRPVWVEHASSGRITFAVEKSERPVLLVTRIADQDLPFGGTWTYRLAAAAGGTTVTLTEDGKIYNPIFRVMAKFVFGYEATMSAYLDALGHRLAQHARQ